MLEWLSSNYPTLIALAAVLAAVAGAVFSLVRRKRSGTCCCGDCEKCRGCGK